MHGHHSGSSLFLLQVRYEVDQKLLPSTYIHQQLAEYSPPTNLCSCKPRALLVGCREKVISKNFREKRHEMQFVGRPDAKGIYRCTLVSDCPQAYASVQFPNLNGGASKDSCARSSNTYILWHTPSCISLR